MSTNKTQNYQLHSWVPEDKFLRAEINENFTKLDGSARVVMGSYTGDGVDSRQITLGFQPRAVLVFNANGQTSSSYNIYGGLALPDGPVMYNEVAFALEVTAQGFTVRYAKISSSYYLDSNHQGTVYRYFAIR